MDNICLFYDSNLSWITGICCGDDKDFIKSDKLKNPKVGIKVGVVPKEITNLHCYIYIDECVYNRLTK